MMYSQLPYKLDADSGQWGPCVVAAMNKFTVEKKGWHGHSLSERGPPPLPGQAFIASLGTLHQGWSSFTIHRFALGDYLLQITKERKLLITSKKKDICKCKGESG